MALSQMLIVVKRIGISGYKTSQCIGITKTLNNCILLHMSRQIIVNHINDPRVCHVHRMDESISHLQHSHSQQTHLVDHEFQLRLQHLIGLQLQVIYAAASVFHH